MATATCFYVTYICETSSCVGDGLLMIKMSLSHYGGGYDTKIVPCSIELIKFDMAGSTTVLGATKALGHVKPDGVEFVDLYAIKSSTTRLRLKEEDYTQCCGALGVFNGGWGGSQTAAAKG
ncbi:leucine aminopeptidase 3, chloroplastic [Artemisia annua]|uniref:Leucine aminopeptidase 3, chloroplastic n=1 Tax=Artemisia annua TaxID=35608 RepID=A0A2U1QKE5_ARTAN|nr:leucine aminopeptidase 3, chloroplastic [Artemisia annua]